MYVYISICKCNTHIHLNFGQGRGFEYERDNDRKLASLHVYRRMCICRRMSIHVWMDVCTYYVCMPVWMDGWMDGLMDVCIHVCIHIHTNTHTVTHICMHMNAYAHACTQERTSCPDTKQRPRGTDRQTAAVPRRNLPPKSHRRYMSSMHSRRVHAL